MADPLLGYNAPEAVVGQELALQQMVPYMVGSLGIPWHSQGHSLCKRRPEAVKVLGSPFSVSRKHVNDKMGGADLCQAALAGWGSPFYSPLKVVGLARQLLSLSEPHFPHL